MDKKQNCIEIAKHMAVLFGAYGQSADIDRQKIYVADLADFPAELVGAACKKLRYEAKFLPTISEIVDATKSLVATSTGKRLPSWLEAQQEIEKQISCAGIYKKPEFSCKEIRQAVQAYGWLNICMSRTSNMPTVWAQLRKLYENTCKYQRSEATNRYVLKDKPQGYLGYYEAKNDGLMLIAGFLAKE
jgi:hypothetical protein